MVRLVNYPKVKSATGERFIKWSQQGPTGPAGAQGVQGPEGYPGPKGDPGPAGVSGSSNWGDIVNKPRDLADGKIGWGEVEGIPAGFADGVDNGGVTAVKRKAAGSTTPGVIAAGVGAFTTADCPAGFLAVGGGYRLEGSWSDIANVVVYFSMATDLDTWTAAGHKATGGDVSIIAQVICLRAEPAGIVTTAKNSHHGSKKAR